jgi:lysophospholipase L1-like esterase
VYNDLTAGDVVMMQFGHNDAAENKPERYVDIDGYQEFLRLYVHQTREKGARPIILTPVNRNYPWVNDTLTNSHGDYPAAARQVAAEMQVPLIDLGQLSINHFTALGAKHVSEHYFMNLPPGTYRAYPDGQSDNTHFQTKGAVEVARLVYEALKEL